jgi:initiation factor 1A
MVKNVKGGKGHKNLARKYTNVAEEQMSVRIKKEEDEKYGVVESILGNGHFYVNCEDDQKRICRIGGKFKKRRRDNLVLKNGFVMVGLYGFETKMSSTSLEKCDLLETYSDSDLKRLFDKEKDTQSRTFINNAIHQQQHSDTSSSSSSSKRHEGGAPYDDGFDFVTEEEWNQRMQMEAIKEELKEGGGSGDSAMDVVVEDEINIDDI